MEKHLRVVWACLLLSYFAGQTGYGQVPIPPPVFPFCTTPDLSPAQALDLIRQGQQAYQQKISSGGAFQNVTYIPIRPHILRRADGSGGMSLELMNQVIAQTNRYYLLNGAGIQFFFAGTSPDYIDNDPYYNSYRNEDEIGMTNGRDATNAMNQYYVNSFASGAGGYAYYPFNALQSTRSFILNENNADDMGNRLIPHELGHNFNLVHTFGQRFGTGTLGSGTTLELVTRGGGANCLYEGDFICDTPADPYNATGAYLTYQNGCPIYDPASTARDANGDAYTPSVSNIMSYYFPCTHDFTPGQYDRMQQALALRQGHTSYTLNASPTNAPAPGNLTGNFTNENVVLTWQDNASNEMGYFIERSTSPGTGFLPIGGVGPNGTTFTDTKAILNTTYYYRIRPSNSTTGNLSPTITVQTNVLLLTNLRTTGIGPNAATLQWDSPGNYTYDVQWRPVGSTTWNTIAGWNHSSYSLSGLTLDVAYEWRAKITGSTAYAGPVRFTTTTCPVPVLYAPSPGPTSVSLYWESGNSPRTYTLQWRQQNAPVWTTVAPINASTYSLTGLTTQTPYDWRVRATCGGATTIVTDYSPTQSFTTLACPVSALSLVSYNSSSVLISWNSSFYAPNNTYTLRYRPAGTTSWTRIEGLTTTSYSVTGLTASITYEIQVETNCSVTERSGFSTSIMATPICPLATYLNSLARATSAQLSWNTNYTREPGTTFGLQYRPVGSMTWSSVITVSALSPSSSVFYSLTGLTTNTTYEWRVQTNCPAGVQSAYSMGPNFTPTCATPTNMNTNGVSITSATLIWNASVEAGTLFELRYRLVGTANWATLSSLTMTGSIGSYRLTSLTPDVQYEAQIRTICSATESSIFSPSVLFNTCSQMYTLRAGNWSDVSLWSCQRLPTLTDSVQIKHAVTISSYDTVMARQLIYDPGQKLVFQPGAKLLLGQ